MEEVRIQGEDPRRKKRATERDKGFPCEDTVAGNISTAIIVLRVNSEWVPPREQSNSNYHRHHRHHHHGKR